jgi:hypothetical protein
VWKSAFLSDLGGSHRPFAEPGKGKMQRTLQEFDGCEPKKQHFLKTDLEK